MRTRTRITTVISIFDGQIPIALTGSHVYAQSALRCKLRHLEDLYGINPLMEWAVIFVDDGDDRRPSDPFRSDRTSRLIYRALANGAPGMLRSGKVRVVELDDAIRRKLRSVQGGAIVYGMRMPTM